MQFIQPNEEPDLNPLDNYETCPLAAGLTWTKFRLNWRTEYGQSLVHGRNCRSLSSTRERQWRVVMEFVVRKNGGYIYTGWPKK